MPLQDLTPQLRTRLSRLERVVGWFVTIAILLLLFGLGYYVYHLAENRGWFLTKMPYFTFVRNATGLAVGDRVRLMGFDVGEILEITAQPPGEYFDVYIQFQVKEPYYGYLWEDSRAIVGAADFLGHRFVEVTKGSNGPPTYAMRDIKQASTTEALALAASSTNTYGFAQDIDVHGTTNEVARFSDALSADKIQQIARLGVANIVIIDTNSPPPKPPKWIWNDKTGGYQPLGKNFKGYWLHAQESPALTERLETVISTVEKALPDFLALTNKLLAVLSNAENIVIHTDDLLVQAKPIVTNAAQITAHLKEPKGSLGEWIIPTNINRQLERTLGAANSTLSAAQTNLSAMSSNILLSLINVANMTSNLSAQVQSSPFVLPQISDLIVHTDEMIQGLKRFWLLRSAFQGATNQPPQSIVQPRMGGER